MYSRHEKLDKTCYYCAIEKKLDKRQTCYYCMLFLSVSQKELHVFYCDDSPYNTANGSTI